MNTYKIGIDLGTTNTVCYMFDRGLEPIPLDSGPSRYSLPSVILYRNGTISVGRIAKQRLESDPDHCIKSSKRHMGENIVLKTIDGRSFTPVDAAAEILKAVKTKALEYFKDTETNARIEAVITVPAYFTANQKADTYKAAEKAGITVLRLIDEPTAAAIASLYEEDNTPWDEKPDKDQRKVLILDIGGGTFDISLVEINNSGDKDIYDPIHIGGDTKLGGDDFDEALYNFSRKFINDNYYINMRTEGSSGLDHDTYSTMQGTLKKECEEAKIELSDEEETEITIENFGGRNYRRIVDIPLSREDFEDTAEDLFDQFENLLKDFWKNNRSDLRGISNVIMVGGTSAIPRLQEITWEITLQKPEFNPDDASNNVAIGAALLASPDKSGVLVQCRTPYPFGIKGRLYTMDIFKEIIPAGTLCPANGERVFYTNRRNQRWMEIEIYRGEKDSDKLIPNGKYGEIRIPIPPWKESGYEILVHFEIDENNIIHVIAEDKIEKTKKEIEITNL